jgi:hypothetical protein
VVKLVVAVENRLQLHVVLVAVLPHQVAEVQSVGAQLVQVEKHVKKMVRVDLTVMDPKGTLTNVLGAVRLVEMI